jgi:4-hydroxybenzoate polyprenyltransferase
MAAPAVPVLPLVRALRPKQWTKNAVLFAGLVGVGRLFDAGSFLRAGAGFFIFCALAGVVYLVNDLADVDRDRAHPRKRLRPIASGALPVPWAVGGAIALASGGLIAAFFLAPPFAAFGAGYMAVMFAYSAGLKNLVLLDVFAIAAGFVIRAAAGAAVVRASLSPWLLVCAALLSLFLALAKRRHELLLLGANAGSYRRTLNEYSPELLEELISVVTSSTVVAYSLYTFFGETVPSNHAMMLTIPFVLYAIFRYLLLIHEREGGGNPDELLVQDRPLLITIALWGVTVVGVLYYFRT